MDKQIFYQSLFSSEEVFNGTSPFTAECNLCHGTEIDLITSRTKGAPDHLEVLCRNCGSSNEVTAHNINP